MSKTKTMYGSISEWDIGLGNMLFRSPAEVKTAQIKALFDCGIEDDYDELEAEGLVGFEEIEAPNDGYGSLTALKTANVVRQGQWPGENKVDTLFRAVEFGGEAGELLDAVKKLHRANNAIAGNTGQTIGDLRQAVMEEMGDVLISLDMLATDLGIPLEDCVPMKFNKTSRKVGIPVEMDPDTWDVQFVPANVEPDLFTR
ncbi:hypothetical protein MAL1_00107 [Bacteriophage DSS3_MAL1]|nr:hypothetical protein MAL1_00107 [Bacteriophage DSS3_MAL1]